MAEWKEYRLEDFTEIITKGTTPSTLGGEFRTNGVNFVKSESLNYEGLVDTNTFAFIDEETHKKLKRSILKENDILFSIAGIYLGKIGVIKKEHLPANTNQACAIIRLKHDEIDYRFVKQYFLEKSFISYVNTLTAQSAQPNINLSDLGKLKLRLPPLETQQKIANILSTYDELIEVNNQRIKTLEETAQALYKEWFIRFRFPNYQNTEFIKGIPKGWEVIKVADAFNILGGGTPDTTNPNFWDGDINWFSPTNITGSDGIFLNESSKKITKEGLQKSSSRMFPKYSVMMTSRATIGAVGINTVDACTNQGFIVCLPNKYFPKEYIYFWILANKEYFEMLASGATFLEISKSSFKKILILKPTEEIIENFKNNVSLIFSQIETLQSQNAELRQIRDRLLPRLISGKITV